MYKSVLVLMLISVTFALIGCSGGSSSTTPDSTAPVSGASLIGGAAQGKTISLTNTVSTITSKIATDGTGVAANFAMPLSITTDGANLFVSDYKSCTIHKMVISTGVVTTIAGTVGVSGSADGIGTNAKFSAPGTVATDGTNLFIADGTTIRKVVISSGEVTTIAGKAGVSGSADGIGVNAKFNLPHGIATDGSNLFVTDLMSYTIRKIVISTGEVTTLAGTAGISGSADGIGSAASFAWPGGIATDGTNLFVADGWNSTIRKIVISTGEVTTFAGTVGVRGSADGVGTAARFFSPVDITSDGNNLFVTDSDNSNIRKIVISTGVVTTVAGMVGVTGSADGTGSTARFNYPFGITTDGSNLFVTDTGNQTIRKVVVSTGVVTTIAGVKFNHPRGLATDGTYLYVGDVSNYTIRKVAISSGVVTTLAGTVGVPGSSDGSGATAKFRSPSAITTDGTNIYVADYTGHTIRKVVISSGVVTTLAGVANVQGSADGIGSIARFSWPNGITCYGDTLFVSDGQNTIRKIIVSTGEVTTIAGAVGVSGSADGIGTASKFHSPGGITTDGINIFVSDSYNFTIRKVVISSGVVTTIAGSVGVSGSADGSGTAARFGMPGEITTDGTNLYVADYGNHTIRKIVMPSGEVTTIAGTTGVSGSDDGVGAVAKFYSPAGITTDGINLFVSDFGNSRIRKIQ